MIGFAVELDQFGLPLLKRLLKYHAEPSVLPWAARLDLAWLCRVSSPISSRNSVPAFAFSNWPSLRAEAMVKAPFSYPNNSISIKSGLSPTQLKVTKGLPLRPL